MANTDGNIFQQGLGRAPANFASLTPLGFLPRTAEIHPERVAVIHVDDPLYQGPGERLGEAEYEAFLATGSGDFAWTPPADESLPIALNYTSGTTGNPKGVVYHHRGAFLESVGNIMMWPLPPRAV